MLLDLFLKRNFDKLELGLRRFLLSLCLCVRFLNLSLDLLDSCLQFADLFAELLAAQQVVIDGLDLLFTDVVLRVQGFILEVELLRRVVNDDCPFQQQDEFAYIDVLVRRVIAYDSGGHLLVDLGSQVVLCIVIGVLGLHADELVLEMSLVVVVLHNDKPAWHQVGYDSH